MACPSVPRGDVEAPVSNILDIIYTNLKYSFLQKKRRGFPDCHNETMKVIQSLHKDDYSIKSIFPLVQAAQRCFEESYAKKKAGSTQKASTLYHLSKYVKRNR